MQKNEQTDVRKAIEIDTGISNRGRGEEEYSERGRGVRNENSERRNQGEEAG